MKFLPLTQSQLGMFLEWNADRASEQYNICIDNRFPTGTVDAARLAAAVRRVFETYPVFRMRFAERDGEVVQFVDESLAFAVGVRTVRESEMDEAHADFRHPFDPFSGPMVRAEVVTTESATHLLLDIFHLIFDGSSWRIFAEAVAAAYEGRELPQEGMTFAGYAALEPTLFGLDDYKVAKEEHAARFAGKTMTVPEGGETGGKSEVEGRTAEEETFQCSTSNLQPSTSLVRATARLPRTDVESFCRAHEVHPNLFFMGVFARTLALYANAAEAVFFTVNHGRRDPRLKGSLGAFVKSVPVLAELKGEKPLDEYLKSLNLHKVGVYPFTHFCRDLGMKPGFGYVFQDGTVDLSLRLNDVASVMTTFSPVGVGRLPTLQVGGDAQSYELDLSLLPGAYSESWCAEFVNRLAEVARQFLAHPDAHLGEIPVVSEAEAAELRELGAGETLEYDRGDTVVAAFLRHAEEHPEHIAFVDCETNLTYGEALRQIEALAVRLREAGVTPGSFVGVMLPRRVSFPVAVLAIQSCGAGYVPLDAEYPEERIAYMLENSGAKVVVDEGFVLGVGNRCRCTKVDDSHLHLHLAPTPSSPAYMIYTSGSTGKPKGVQISNRALMAFCSAIVKLWRLDPESRIAVASSFSFDASVMDLFPVMLAGGTLHVISEEMRKDLAAYRDYIAKEAIDGCTLSTHFGLALLNAYPDVALKFICLGGEKLVPYPPTKVKVYNGYGPTEFTVASSFHLVDQNAPGDIPIGRPIANSRDLLVDRFGQLVPRGMRGELCLAGPQIAEGYWNLPEKTAKAFVNGYYHTGDYAAWNEAGLLMYKGRIDKQVKLRGFRIEMGEIEAAMAKFPGISEAVAEVREIGGVEHLVGYYVEEGRGERSTVDSPSSQSNNQTIKQSNNPTIQQSNNQTIKQSNNPTIQQSNNSSLRDFLSQSLAAYMVPDYFVAMEKLPVTPGGKIDRKALPLPEIEAGEIVEPANETEAKILAVARGVLKTDRIGVTHDLAGAGLTSLGAMALAAKLKKECGLAVTLAELAKAATVRGLAEKVVGPDLRAGRRGRRPLPAANSPRPRRTYYPMTENQRGVYADWLKNPATTQYNVPVAFRFPGLDASALASAAEKVVDAHPALKARFVEKDGEIVQERRDAAKIAVVRETLDAEPDAAFFAARMRPFAPQGEDLARVAVFDVKEKEETTSPRQQGGVAYLFLDAHHTVFDGFSMGVFLQDLLAALDGRALAGEDATLFDAGLEDRDYLESELVAEDDAWFAKYLDGCESTSLESSEPPAPGIAAGTEPGPPLAAAAGTEPGPPLAAAAGTAGRAVAHVPAEALNRRAAELGVSASDWFLTALMELLRRIGRSDDVQILFVSAGRGNADYAESVGMFVRTLPVRNVRDEATFSATVKRLHADVLALRDRDRASYARIAEKNGLAPEIIFAYEGGLFDLPRGASLIAPPTATAKFPLSVTVTPGKEDFELCFEYDASRYGAHEMELLVGLFAHLAEGAVAEDSLRAIPLLGDEARAEAEKMAYGGDLEYDAEKTFVDLLRAIVLTRSFATAVVDGKGSMTYGELGAASDALAAALVEKGVKPGEFVAVKLGRVKEFVVAAIGIMKAGAGYVPIDPDYPAERIAYMVEDSGAKVVVDEGFLAELRVQGSMFKVGEGARQETRDENPTFNSQLSTFNLATPASPAYMIYTSGSTGKPKGVVVPHRALRHLIEWTRRDRAITYRSRVVEHASFSFDASVIDIFPVLAAGGELHLFAEELRKDLPGMRDYIVKNGITIGTFSTQIGMALVDAYPDLPLHNVMFGGEKLLPVAKTDVMQMNGYGPTEFCVCSSYQIVDQDEKGDIPIGRAVPGTWSFVVDRYGHLLPQGLAGEIALAGPQIADGYWHQPEKTEKAFVELPWLKGIGVGERCRPTAEFPPALNEEKSHHRTPTPNAYTSCYRTGDLARYDAKGRLLYLGRMDFQVKLRGFRIEIGEIEHAASSFPGIGAVAAEVRDVGGAKHLVLYYEEGRGERSRSTVDDSPSQSNNQTIKQSNNQTIQQSNNPTIQQSNNSSLKDFLAKSLTAYMVPDFYVRLDAMPMTPNGKINRKALPAPTAAAVEREYVAPREGAEKTIAEAWGALLKIERYGATDDFFASGGTSLLGIKAVVALQKAGLDVQYGDLFKHKTPRDLAAFLGGSGQGQTALPTTDGQPSAFNLQPSTFAPGSYDYAAIDALLAKTRTELFGDFRVHSLGDVLLTGATGYLGIHVLRYLLEKTSSSVTVLLRPKGKAGPERRLDAQYVYYFGERLPKRFHDRVSYVAGDITDTQLFNPTPSQSNNPTIKQSNNPTIQQSNNPTIKQSNNPTIKQSNNPTIQQSNNLPTISTVINCAALVKHYIADDALDRVNVKGVENLLAWCAETGARFVQTSTYSVGGSVDAVSPVRLDERHLFVGQDSDNDYIRTKFLAERAVLSAVAAGKVRAKIMRLGNLMGREADGEFQMNVGANAFVNSLKSYSAIGAYPLDELAAPLEMSPIDRVAEAVCLLATTPDDMVVFHPYNAYALDMGAVLGALNRRGHAVDYTSRAEFAARVDALKADPTRAEDLQGILHYAQRHLDGRKVTPVANAWTTTVLYRLGFRWKPAEDRYLANFFDGLDGLAVFG